MLTYLKGDKVEQIGFSRLLCHIFIADYLFECELRNSITYGLLVCLFAVCGNNLANYSNSLKH